MAKSFLCLFLCLVAGAAASCADAKGYAARQSDALDKLFYDWTRLQRPAGNGGSWETAALESRTYAQPQQGSKESDKISELPGQPQGVDFDQYGGYVTVDGEAGRALFYYFAQAARTESSSKPLLLWLNGGPGCSSLGYGAMEELGPFRVMSDGKTLYRNPYAWNKAANVLFLESPAGVGFSYSNSSDDYRKSGDKRTAEDAYVFLVNWLERFPEYKGRDFYIAGESYAGHYVPQLAQTILHHNLGLESAAANPTIIHLKGIMIGNAVINVETDSRGMYDFFGTHALISDNAIEGIHKYCNFSPIAVDQLKQCRQTLETIDVGNLNIYNIYAPLCFSTGITPTPKRNSVENFDPCTDTYVHAYLNNDEVQAALHANITKLNYTWSSCSQVISNWVDSPSTILPLIKELIDNKVQVWVYSGDIDGRVPVTSTRYSLNELKLQVKSQWKPWSINNEVGGYSIIYDGNLTFATIRGAGHEVPSYQALRALMLIEYFIKGNPLPA